jgi:predicted ATPase
MMPRIRHIHVEGYLSFANADLELRNLNVFIGANGSGKSNLIALLGLLKDMASGRLQRHIGTHGGPRFLLHFGPKISKQIKIDLSIEHEQQNSLHTFCLERAVPDTFSFAEESIDLTENPQNLTLENTKRLESAGHIETRLGEWRDLDHRGAIIVQKTLQLMAFYHFSNTSPTSDIRGTARLHDHSWLAEDAGNLAAVLFHKKKHEPMIYNRIVSAVKQIIPDFDDFELWPELTNEQEIFLKWRKVTNKYYDFYPHQTSDGSLRVMALCTILLQSKKTMPPIIVLDEPELGLHPSAINILAGMIRAASLHSQVIVATQSQQLLNGLEPEDIVTVNMVNGGSQFRRLDSASLEHWLKEYSLSQLWDANVIEAGPMS